MNPLPSPDSAETPAAEPADGAAASAVPASPAPSRWKRRLTSALLWSAAAGMAVAVVLVVRLIPPRGEPAIEAHVRPAPVRTSPALGDGLVDVLEIPGRIEPHRTATVAAEKPGRIVEIAVDRGDRVAAGQVLARLNAEAWTARMRMAEVELDDAARDLARIEQLARSGATAQSQLDAALARRDRARATLDDAREQVRQCEVHSPIDGEIVDRHAEVGEYAVEGRPLARVVDVSAVKVVFDIPERAVADATAGRSITFTVDGLGDGIRTAAVTYVSAEGDPRSNTFRAEARLANGDGALRGGMIARVRIARPAPPSWAAVPLAAVIPRRGEHVVFVVENGRAVRRQVVLERIAAGMALVSGGVRSGETVIVEGHRSLSDGAAVEIRNADGAAAEPRA